MNSGKDIVVFSYLMYQQGYSVGSEGNISVRKSLDGCYIAPSNMIKNILKKKDTMLLNSLGVDPFQKSFLSEAVMFLKDVIISEFALPSTNDRAGKIREICKHTDMAR